MKTNTQHTPGPWKLAAGVIGPDKVWMEDSQGNETMICRGVENEHDAALIAAAPELLSALQIIQNILAQSIPIDYKRDCFESLKIANAAIAKATGV